MGACRLVLSAERYAAQPRAARAIPANELTLLEPLDDCSGLMLIQLSPCAPTDDQ
jgi:hypothetical protein